MYAAVSPRLNCEPRSLIVKLGLVALEVMRRPKRASAAICKSMTGPFQYDLVSSNTV